MVRHCSSLLMLLCGVQTRVIGEPARVGAVLWVANHISWLDIFVLNRVRATCFVAKSDIRHWPVIGWLVAGAGTVFIERSQRHAIKGVSQQMDQRFRRGEAVGLFPESTTSEGLNVRPFHAGLFEAAIAGNVDIQPVALRFYQHGERTVRFAFVGDQSLMGNLWTLLSSRGVSVECEFLDRIPAGQCAAIGRSNCADLAYQAVRQAVEQP